MNNILQVVRKYACFLLISIQMRRFLAISDMRSILVFIPAPPKIQEILFAGLSESMTKVINPLLYLHSSQPTVTPFSTLL